MPLREPGEFLAAERAEEERDPERYRRQRVTEVVDHIGEKRDRTRHNENRRLHPCRKPEHGEADRDGFNALA